MKQSRATLFGLPNSPEAYELRDFLKRSGFPFEWIDLKTDDDARRLAGVTGLDDPRLPVCVMEKGSVLFRPTIRDLAAALDWFRGPNMSDMILRFMERDGRVERRRIRRLRRIENHRSRTVCRRRQAEAHPGSTLSRISDGISGWELASRARQQLSVWVPKSLLR